VCSRSSSRPIASRPSIWPSCAARTRSDALSARGRSSRSSGARTSCSRRAS
jgi:hypothetical protein